MRVVIEKPPEDGEEELIVRVNQLSERVLELLRVIQVEDEKLMCYHEDGSLSVLCPSSVFYFESVDNRVYAYEKSGGVGIEAETLRTGTTVCRNGFYPHFQVDDFESGKGGTVCSVVQRPV